VNEESGVRSECGVRQEVWYGVTETTVTAFNPFFEPELRRGTVAELVKQSRTDGGERRREIGPEENIGG
jgi:hypothetical protein